MEKRLAEKEHVKRLVFTKCAMTGMLTFAGHRAWRLTGINTWRIAF